MNSDNVFRNARKYMKSGDTDAFIKLLENTSPIYRKYIIDAARREFGYSKPEMFSIMFEYGYFPKVLIPSKYKEDLNEFEEFIVDIAHSPFIIDINENPNMDYILGTLDVINSNIKGGLASYTRMAYKRGDYPVNEITEINEISYNILNIYMGAGNIPFIDDPPIFLKLVELGVPIPDSAIHMITKTDTGVFTISSHLIDFIICNTFEKLILLGWINTLKLLYKVMPDIVITGLNNAKKYLDIYEAQIARWKTQRFFSSKKTIFEYYKIDFYNILTEMHDFINSILILQND
jgi:hypothetical protein